MKDVVIGAAAAALMASPALAQTAPAIEPVYSAAAGRNGVVVRLASNGCTRKADLTVAIAKTPPRPMLLVARKHPDRCRALVPGGVEIAWTWKELDLEPGQPFSLANPLMAEPGTP